MPPFFYWVTLINVICISPPIASLSFGEDCNHYLHHPYSTSPSQQILESITIENNTIEIKFKILLNNYCNTSLCNILYIADSNDFIFLSLSINTQYNYFQISSTDKYTNIYNTFGIQNANQLLPIDHEYHTVYLLYAQNEQIFRVDNKTYYSAQYHNPLSIQTNEIYALYTLGSLNATIKEMCIKSINNPCAQCEAKILQCNDVDVGELLSPSDIDYIYFRLDHDASIWISSCYSYFDTYLYLYDMNGSILYQSDDGVCISTNADLSINNLKSGGYVLGVSGAGTDALHDFGFYFLYTECVYTVTNADITHINNQSEFNYILVPYVYTWFDAQFECEQLFGSSLATIITEQDMNDAIYVINQTVGSDHQNILIGLYRDAVTEFEWQWVDGTYIDANGTDIDETYQIATYLHYISSSNVSMRYKESTDLSGWFLCNTANSKYVANNCTNKCWLHMDCCNASILSNDTIVDVGEFRPPVAYWDSNLFLLGFEDIHYSSFGIFSNSYSWNHTNYRRLVNDDVITGNQALFDSYGMFISQQYAQYQSYLYLYMQFGNLVYSENSYLLIIDLNDVTVKGIPMPTFGTSQMDISCVVADVSHVYILKLELMIIYNVDLDDWQTSIWDGYYALIVSACAITNNHEFIYIFRYYALNIIKYDTTTSEFLYILNTPHLCHSTYARAITAANGKIYLSGCYTASWKTLIFDPETEQFETETLDIEIPTATDVGYYRKSQLVRYDDNILLLLYESGSGAYPVYYTITDLISVNFRNTISTIWPSDGFMIRYYRNDFSNVSNNVYYVWFQCHDTVHNITQEIILNVAADHCICNDTNANYTCLDCNQPFDLINHLTLMDNHIDELQFYILPHEWNQMELVIVPDTVTITLQRCHISFKNIKPVLQSDNPLIVFNYNLSSNCNSRIGTEFSLNITSLAVNIGKQLTITFMDNKTETCVACDVFDTDKCVLCNDRYIELDHGIINSKTFKVSFVSNTIDLVLNAPNIFEITYSETKQLSFWDSLSVSGKVVIVVAPFVFVLCVIGIIGHCYKRNKKLKEEVLRQLQFEYKIKNPMILAICIEEYDEDADNPGIDVYCSHLNGVYRDYENMKSLCKLYKYDIYPKQLQTEWTEQEIIEFLEQRAKAFSENIQTDSNESGFDSILVVISGHGYKNSIITSDYQTIHKTAIHRLFSTNYPDIRHLPRVFIFDCCDGDQERCTYHFDDEGKNFKVGDIKIKQYDEIVWGRNQLNPDYKVSCIHAANEGFQAKMNSIDGSYLIYEFVKRMILNIQQENVLFFGEIIDQIQQYLHDKGKQQLTSTFANNTRYLKFIPNDYLEQITNDEQKLLL